MDSMTTLLKKLVNGSDMVAISQKLSGFNKDKCMILSNDYYVNVKNPGSFFINLGD
jgi:hypothetical protein